ncbi:MAG: response regulator, partial [Gammaproteobacteria bacterium]
MNPSIKRLLIVDDDASFRKLIERYINLLLPDTEVIEHDPVTAGLPSLDGAHYDLIILDYFLNGPLTGLDLLNDWKKRHTVPPVIMMTGEGNEEVAVRAMKFGVHDYLRKQNITKEKMRESLLDAVNSHKQQQEQQTANQANPAFNKVQFYKKLEQAGKPKAGKHGRVFFLIDLDDYETIGDEKGIVIQDNVMRHVAQIAYDTFVDYSIAPSVTRMSDSTVGVLIEPDVEVSLFDAIAQLNDNLSGQPYDQDGTLVPFTASIGVVRLQDSLPTAAAVIKHARAACAVVRQRGGNGHHIYDAGNTPLTEKPEPAADVTDAKTPAQQHKPAGKSPVTTADKPAAEAETEAQADTPAATDSPAEKPATVAKAGPGVDATPGRVEEAPAPAPPPAPPPAPVREKDLLEMTLEMPAERLQAVSTTNNESPTGDILRQVDLDSADADNTGDYDIAQAFADNRIMPYYQPVMPLSDQATQLDAEYFSVRVRMVDTDGSVINADKIISGLQKVRNQKLLDRWMLRETLGRIVEFINDKKPCPVFVIKISEESFADTNLFTWLQNKLMKQVAHLEPGKHIIIEVSLETYTTKRKQVQALMKFLRQSYAFGFAISGFKAAEEIDTVISDNLFRIVKIKQPLLATIQ